MKKTILKKIAAPMAYLFWKTQISVLRACPPLQGAISAHSMGAANSKAVWFKTLFRAVAGTPQALLRHWRDKRGHRVVLSRVNMAVTMRCTLNCDKCAVHVPDLQPRTDIPAHEMVRDIQSLLACVDTIYVFCLSGGEALLHSELDIIIRACAKSKKIMQILVQTNGTLIPHAKVLAALKASNAFVQISRYEQTLQPKVEELKRILRENGIGHAHSSSTAWSDLGDFGQPQKGSARQRFSFCTLQLCRAFYEGKLHLCGVSAFLMNDGYLPDNQDTYIDVRTADAASFYAQWKKLLKKRALPACSYCLGETYQSPKVPVAAQRL